MFLIIKAITFIAILIYDKTRKNNNNNPVRKYSINQLINSHQHFMSFKFVLI